MKNKPSLSIIIKALNEEENIERAITSSLAETKHLDAEIILADSLSTDKTIEIAKRFPVRIVQLSNPHDRSCGVGPQLGFQYAKGTYVYILDGDMAFEKGFLEQAIKELEKDETLAGVAGRVREMRSVNFVFKRRKDSQKAKEEIVFVDRLEMGGLYRREALENIGYFSNRNLHAYEEADLGFQLVAKGWKLCRLPIPGIMHYGYNTTSFGVFQRRWKTRYVKGSGEFLRAAIGKKQFWKVAYHLKIYLVLLGWWVLLILFLFLARTSKLFIAFLLLTGIFLLAFLIKKKSLSQWAFSLVSWHYSMLGLVWGFCSPQRDPKKKIASKVIQ